MDKIKLHDPECILDDMRYSLSIGKINHENITRIVRILEDISDFLQSYVDLNSVKMG